MATWPSGSKASTANLDAGTDKPSLARADIKQNVDNVNDIIDMFNISGPSNNQILKYNSTNTRFELASDSDLNTTYAISAETVAGGANLRLTGSDAVTDDVKIASGTGITVSRTDANTITVASTVTDTNTTYSIAAITDGLDANIRLTGSDASIDEIQLIAGTNITLGVTSAGAIQISSTASGGMTSFTVAADSGASQTINDGNTLTIVGGTNITSVASATDTVTLNLDATLTGLTAVTVTTLNTNAITGVTVNGDIVITPNGTGDVDLVADTVVIGDLNASATLSTNGTGDLVLNTNLGSNSGSITIANGLNGNITLAPNGTGDVYVDADTLRIGDVNAGATLTTNGTGDLTLSTNSGTNSGTITIVQGVNGDISLQPNGTGDVKILADTTLIGDNNVNAVLTTNGTGNLTISTNAGSNSGTITIVQGTNGDISLQPNGTGDVKILADTTLIGDDGVAAVLTTNGAGNLTISTNAGTNSGTIVITQGANGDITLTPNGTGTVNFADKVVRQAVLKDYAETVYNIGNSGGTLAIDPANGNLQKIRLTSSWTFSGFTGGVSGHSVTILVQQDGTGSKTFSEGLSSNNAMVWAGGVSTLSTAANALDMLTIVLIDSVYYASLSKGFV